MVHTWVPSLTYIYRCIQDIRKTAHFLVLFQYGAFLSFTRLVWGGLTNGFKKISELTASEKFEHEFVNAVRSAKAELAVVPRKIGDLTADEKAEHEFKTSSLPAA